MINPVNKTLPKKDSEEIRSKILLKVRAELIKRINKGYSINLSFIDEEVNKFIEEHNVG
tara:strand:+ start:3988 stop:4164 length:177 start_codon:yes stop_codon:yes gene_type:complete